MIDVTTQVIGDIHVLELCGTLNTTNSPEVEEIVNEVIDEGANNIILDLDPLDMISSTGLRIILATGKKLHKLDGKIVLCNPNKIVMDVLKMSGFSTMFEVFHSLDEALASLKE